MEIDDLLTSRPAGHRGLSEWYLKLIETGLAAGLSTDEIAKRAGCSRVTIYAWRRRLGLAARSPRFSVDADQAPPRLVQVQVAPSSTPLAKNSTFEVRLRSGHSVLIPIHFDPSALSAVVRALEQC